MAGEARDLTVRYDPLLIAQLKRTGVKIRKSFKHRLVIFQDNPLDPRLNNHELKDPYTGYRSININADWRAIYQVKETPYGKIAYFIDIGTHKQLYK